VTLRIPIEDVRPSVDCREYSSKAVVDEIVPIYATAYRDGHDAIGVNVVWHGPDGRVRPFTRMRPDFNDLWRAAIQPDAVGEWTFEIEAFSDPYLTWRHAVTKKVEAGQGPQDLANDIAEGAAVLERAASAITGADRERVRLAAAALRDERIPLGARISPALDLSDVMWEHPVREMVSTSAPHQIWVDRQRALFSAWYELFPRSEGATLPKDGVPARSGTFRTAAKRLPGVAAMGFDIVYLPPIHPIGKINRKGKNNALTAGPDDVGSPWAIGSDEGGHDAIHPDLGTLDDFRFFVDAAREAGLEVALDLALQCAPDHPWVKAHPKWFTTKPDGTIAYAENPPKKYQDIYPVNFDNDPDGIRAEVLRVVRHWIEQGVKVFRVDNPHTKPFDFWHWLIWEVKATDPDVLFLAEAFTRPALMHGLAKLGFSQSYTYFTWRTTAHELRQYCEELAASADYMRPNFWPNTPDILHESLQHGGPPMFRIRAVLASMLMPSWGMYAGYELYEHMARPGAEEYLDNEKYELRPRNWAAAERSGQSLAPYIASLNRIRRDNAALHWLRNLRFHDLDSDALLCWSKRDEQTGNTVLVVCTLDPYHDRWANTTLDMPALGFDWHERFNVVDELTGARYQWGQHNAVHLDPYVQPAHVFTVHRLDEAPKTAAAVVAEPAVIEAVIAPPPEVVERPKAPAPAKRMATPADVAARVKPSTAK
jgi:starch synthase (maltosyl-transferring)